MFMQTQSMRAKVPAPVPQPAERTDGIVTGTIVLALSGECAVEDLVPGDRIITRDSGVAVLRDIEIVEETVIPVRIKAGSLGHRRPQEDVIVPQTTHVHIRDWRAQALFGHPSITVPAERLVDGEFIAEEAPRRMRLCRLVFDRPHVIYAGGIEVHVA